MNNATRTEKLITVVTTTRNCIDIIPAYFKAFVDLDRTLFDWILVDAASDDGTREYLAEHASLLTRYTSEPDRGTYFGLNKAVAQVATPYYVVFGADDRPSHDFFEKVLPLLRHKSGLVLGSTRLMPSGNVKPPGNRRWHHWTWGRVISHHSVGTVIRTDLHRVHGMYDTRYRVVADGDFLKKVLRAREPITMTEAVFGDYEQTGLSDQNELLGLWESFVVQVVNGSNFFLQLALLNLRLLRKRKKLLMRTGLGPTSGGTRP